MNIKILIAITIISLALAQNYSDCKGKLNQHPLISTSNAKLISSVAHGKRYKVTDPKNPLIHVHIAVLSGTAYEMGYAMGTLFKSEVKTFVKEALAFIYGTDFSWVQVLPKWLKDIPGLSNKAKMDYGFDFEKIATERFTPQRFFDELRGIADASGVDYTTLLKINLFPELTRAICTILGVWGPASADGNLYHLRALDYLPQAFFNNLAAVIIYHPTEPGSQQFANLGWVGMVGSLAGYNGHVGIGEKAWVNNRDTTTTIFGEPWMFVVRDVVQFATDIDSAIDILQKANRTYNIRLGVAVQRRIINLEVLSIHTKT